MNEGVREWLWASLDGMEGGRQDDTVREGGRLGNGGCGCGGDGCSGDGITK